jgi:hypothetical protein
MGDRADGKIPDSTSFDPPFKPQAEDEQRHVEIISHFVRAELVEA